MGLKESSKPNTQSSRCIYTTQKSQNLSTYTYTYTYIYKVKVYLSSSLVVSLNGFSWLGFGLSKLSLPFFFPFFFFSFSSLSLSTYVGVVLYMCGSVMTKTHMGINPMCSPSRVLVTTYPTIGHFNPKLIKSTLTNI